MKKVLTFSGIVLLFAFLILIGLNYDKNTDQDKRLKRIEDWRQDHQGDYYELFNEREDWTALHDHYYDSITVALNSVDKMLTLTALTLAEKLFALLTEIDHKLTEVDSALASETRIREFGDASNLEMISILLEHRNWSREQTIELAEEKNFILKHLGDHGARERGLFKKPHDKKLKSAIEMHNKDQEETDP